MKASVLAFVLSLAVVNATAGSTVYKCKDGKGGLLFRDVPCDIGEQTQTVKNYDAPRTCGSSCGAQKGNARAGTASPRDDQDLSQNSVSTQQQEAPSGYQCSGNGKTWVQSSPCPASTTSFTPVVGVNGFDQHGRYVTGATGWEVGQAPVQQQGLSHDDLCTKLKENPATSDNRKTTAGEAAYERNNQRQSNGC